MGIKRFVCSPAALASTVNSFFTLSIACWKPRPLMFTFLESELNTGRTNSLGFSATVTIKGFLDKSNSLNLMKMENCPISFVR